MEVFRGQTCPNTIAIRLLPIGNLNFLILCIISGCQRTLLGVVAVVNDFFYLMFDLLLADGSVSIWRIL